MLVISLNTTVTDATSIVIDTPRAVYGTGKDFSRSYDQIDSPQEVLSNGA